jgi:hypothetical protein
MTIEKRLLGTTPAASSGAVDPEAVSFDGTNDYLSRSTSLTGSTDGKTLTCSFWLYFSSISSGVFEPLKTASGAGIRIQISNAGAVNLIFKSPSNSTIVNADSVSGAVPFNTWSHFLLSVDQASTGNRYLYVNDNAVSVTWNSYVNGDISRSVAPINIQNYNASDNKSRYAHFFLDYTYRDLSIEANRRLFIDSDGKPSSTIPSSPILYLPLTDAATAGSNSGTGGDFTVNGVLDTAGRAPNQFNCSASEFDGSNDYLTKTYLNSYTPNKTLTISMVFRIRSDLRVGTTDYIFDFYSEQRETLRLYVAAGTLIVAMGSQASGNDATRFIMNNSSSSYPIRDDREVAFTMSLDATDPSKRSIYINGVALAIGTTLNSSGWTSYADQLLLSDLDSVDADGLWICADRSLNETGMEIGEVWIDNTYYDLTTDNPFWNSDTNRPKPVRQVISETGTTPLIAMPLSGDDAGNNLGSGGDFTVNSGPYTGARGGSEFWARSASFDGVTTNYLTRADSAGATDNKLVTLAFSFIKQTTGSYAFSVMNGIADKFFIRIDGSDINLQARNSAGTRILDVNFAQATSSDVWYTLLLSLDLSNAANRHCYINGSSVSFGSPTYTNDNIGYTSANEIRIGGANGQGAYSGDLSAVYFINSYIDFSQESNRNLFVDQLGYPKDLTPAIDAGDIPDPLIYMKFDDTSALGTNSGTGGDFTVNGTVTAGADVDPNA